MGQKPSGLTSTTMRTTGRLRRLNGRTGQKPALHRTNLHQRQSMSPGSKRNQSLSRLHQSKCLRQGKRQNLSPSPRHLSGQTLPFLGLVLMRRDKRRAPASHPRVQVQTHTRHQQARRRPRLDHLGPLYPQSRKCLLSPNRFKSNPHCGPLSGNIPCMTASLPRLHQRRLRRTTSIDRGEKFSPVDRENSSTRDLVGMNLCLKPERDPGEASSTSARRPSCKGQRIMSKPDRQSRLQHSRLAGQAFRMVGTGRAVAHRPTLVGEVVSLDVGCLLGVPICPRSRPLKPGEDLK